jgi:hypothetical protein
MIMALRPPGAGAAGPEPAMIMAIWPSGGPYRHDHERKAAGL